MTDTAIAKIFMHGRSQAARLPKAFRLPGDRVRVRRAGSGILLEPIVTDLDVWFAELDRFRDVPFMEDGRRQPSMPESANLSEFARVPGLVWEDWTVADSSGPR